MTKITFRLSEDEREKLEEMAKKNDKNTSDYIRLKLFAAQEDNFTDKINFYQNVNSYLAEISKRNLILNQMVYQLMVNGLGEEQSDQICAAISEQVDNYIKSEDD